MKKVVDIKIINTSQYLSFKIRPKRLFEYCMIFFFVYFIFINRFYITLPNKKNLMHKELIKCKTKIKKAKLSKRNLRLRRRKIT